MLTLVARLRRSARSQQFASAFVARIASAVLGFVLLLPRGIVPTLRDALAGLGRRNCDLGRGYGS